MSGLRFRRVQLRRMPGFPNGGFSLDDLSPGLNIVFGPNASGKTTTADALAALLWPAAAPARASVFGRVELDGGDWKVDLDAGHVGYERDGQESGPPVLPPAEARDRYRLPLHELLDTHDRSFAEQIRRESAGGYDIAAAAAAAGFRSGPSAARVELNALRQARVAVAEARRRQNELVAEARELERLEARLAEADAALLRLRLLDRASAYAAAKEEAASAARALEAFEPGMKELRADDAETLAALRDKLESAHADAAAARRELEEARGALAAAAIPDDGLPDDAIPTLRTELQRLRELEREIDSATAALEAARRRRDEERRVLGEAVEDQVLAGIDRVAMEELADFARRAEALRAERAAARAERGWLEEPGPADDPQRLRRGLFALNGWLRASGPASSRRLFRVALAGGLLGLVAGVLLALLTALVPYGIVLAVLGGLLVALAAWPTPDAPSSAAHRREFLGLGLDAPAEWSPEAVRRLADELSERLAKALVAEEQRRRREQVDRRLEELEAEAAELDSLRAEVARRFGVAPEIAEPNLYWLANRISRWQDAARAAGDASAELDAARTAYHGTLERLAGRLAPYGYPAPATPADAAGAIEDLDRRRQQHAAAAARLRAGEERLKRAETAARERESEIAAIFARLGLAAGEEAVVRAWCGRHPAYLEAVRRLEIAERDRGAAEAELRADAGFEPALAERDADDLALERERTASVAAERDELNREITRIRTRIDAAKSAHDLEAALAERARREEALRALREQDVAAVVGWALADHLHGETRDHARPAVFERARELLLEITAGRYRLEFADGEPPGFRAVDTRTDVWHTLDELSSATRVQLLLAVRVAFVEQQEDAGVRLPLLLDETLANSDDRRAEAIMRAMIVLARGGRQLFYFTAQADEVGKWVALLEKQPEAPAYRVIDLAEVQGERSTEPTQPLAIAPLPRRTVPEPDGRNRDEYGDLLEVPPLDPRPEALGAVHLWYLIEEPESLYPLLELGIESWGAFRDMVKYGGRALGGGTEAAFEEASTSARALRSILERRAQGRGRPVDRQALLDSDAVTETFLEAAVALADSLDGDAAELLDALRRGEIPRFQRRKVDELETFFVEHGFLDPRPRLSAEEIRARVIGDLADLIGAGRIDGTRLDRLLRRSLVSA